MMQFDVHTGRPYDRINKLCGTKAVHNGYPSRLYIDKEELAYWDISGLIKKNTKFIATNTPTWHDYTVTQ